MFCASAQTAAKIGLVDTQSVIQAMPETTEAQKKVADASKKYEERIARVLEKR